MGLVKTAPRLDNLRPALSERLQRGELTNVGKHYLAASVRFTPNLRWNYGGLVLVNLDDGSALTQFGLNFLPSDYTSLDFGVIYGFGDDLGDEYRGLRVSSDPRFGRATSGGGGRVYLRLARYF